LKELFKWCFALVVLVIIFTASIKAQSVSAFPGAEGSAATAVGGRYGSVYKVTNLNTEGPGSFMDAVSQPNRIIVFTVSGIIDYQGQTLMIDKDDLTIAGQTAPGDGICFKGTTVRLGGRDVIARFLRSRVGYFERNGIPDHKDGFSIDLDGADKVIADHISVSWASDENLTNANDTKNITVQNCFIAEGLNYFDPNNSPNRHGFGSIIGSDIQGAEVNFHHNLYAHHEKRSPRFASRDGKRNFIDFRNNVIYDCYDETGLNNPNDSINANYIGNYLKYGPNTPDKIKYQLFAIGGKFIQLYAEDNYVYEHTERTADNWKAMVFEKGASLAISKADSAFPSSSVTTQTAEAAYEYVLDSGGALLPSRDFNDSRVAGEVRNGTGLKVEYETDLGENPWGEYYSLPYPKDSDEDGMPDFWEDQYGLNKNVGSDNMTISSGGYANIEHYINNTDPTGQSSEIIFVGGYNTRIDENRTKHGSFRIYRNTAYDKTTTVKYSVSGDAASGVDFQTLSGEAVIPAGADFVEVPVKPISDSLKEGDEKVIITLTSMQYGYKIGCPSQTLLVIKDADQSTDISENENQIPSEFNLEQNFPNPFNSETQINYTIAARQNATLEIFDLLGRSVKRLVDSSHSPGKYTAVWDGTDAGGKILSSGIYFYRMITDTEMQSRKMILLE
jgi:hypothetical protein